jgi:hypothetical protein
MGFMALDPNNDRGHQIDGASEKGQEYQVVRIFGKDRLKPLLPTNSSPGFCLLAANTLQIAAQDLS